MKELHELLVPTSGHGVSGARRALLVTACAGAIVAMPALAQTEPAAGDASGETQGAGASDIVVSAKRIGVTEQTAPLAVTGLNADDIAMRGISGTQDLQTQVPGLNAGLELGIPKLYIRGIGQEATTLGQDPAVTTYVDGVPIARSKAGYLTQVDIARVEVLRGPQGTVFGRNATAGAVNYITQRPRSELGVTATAGAGNYDRFMAGATVNLPLSEDVAFRVAGTHNEHSGYVRNLGSGASALDSENADAVRASVQYRTSDVTVVLSGDYVNQTSNGPAFLVIKQAFAPPYGIGPNNFVLANGRRLTKLNAGAGQANYTRSETYGTSLTIEMPLSSSVQLKSISGYRHLDFQQAQDSDGTDVVLEGANPVITRSDQYSQEFNLSAQLGQLNGVVGLFAFHEKAFEGNDVNFFGGLLDPNLDLFFGPGTATSPALLSYDTTLRTTSLAAFADASFAVTPAIRLNGGIRYTRDTKKDLQTSFILLRSTARGSGILLDSCGAPGGTTPASVDSTLKNSKLTWKAGVDADLSDNVFGYATVSTGYKAGGFTDFSLCGLTFRPENAKNYELGLKTRLFDNAATLRIAAYYLDYTNLQVQRTTAFGTTTINAPGAKIYGVEAEGNWRFNENLKIDGTLSWMRSKYSKGFFYLHGSRPDLQDPVTGLGPDIAGNRLPRTPDVTLNLGLEGKVPFDNGSSLTARIEGYYSARFSFNPPSDPRFPNRYGSDADIQPAYALGNAYVTYDTGKGVQLRGWVRNFTNEFYMTSSLALALPGYNAGFAAPPRTFGLDATVKF